MEDIAVRVEGVSKSFKIPHQKLDSVRGVLFNIGKKRTYEELKALHNITFQVKKGEFLGIIGKNGSGKSTLLKVLAGIYPPDSGIVEVHGRVCPFLELGVGFNLELSARDNIYLNGVILGLTKKQIDEKFDKIISFAGLEKFVDTPLKNFSSGMYVRLAFSVAIQADADILLMDEVLAVGDVNFQRKCIEEFEKYKQKGKTVILVTHNLEAVKSYCDRAMLLEKGSLIFIGNPTEVADEYLRRESKND